MASPGNNLARKRPRLEDKDRSYIQHPTLYFDDGNTIISCKSTLFRVHRTLLSKHSPVFKALFERRAAKRAEPLLGCLHIAAEEDREEVEALLNVIYDGL